MTENPDIDTLWRELGFTPGARPDSLGRLLALIRQTAREAARHEVLAARADGIFAASRPGFAERHRPELTKSSEREVG